MPQSFRRNVNWELTQYIPAPTQGWNPDSIPWELPEAQAPVLDNFLIRPGNIMARGAFSQIANTHSTAPAPAAGVPAGVMMVSNIATNGYMPWDAPVVGTDISLAAVADTQLTWVDSVGGIANSTLGSRHLVPGPRWINFDGLLYGLSFDSEATALHDAESSYFIPATRLLTQPFVTGGGPSGVQPVSGAGTVSGTNWTTSGTPFNLRKVYTPTVANTAATTAWIQTNFGFTIPGSTTITDIAVFIDRAGANANSGQISVQLVHSGAPIGSAFTSAITSAGNSSFALALSDFGSPTLTDAEVNSSTFGVQVLFTNNSGTTAPANNYGFGIISSIQSITYSGTISTPSPTALTSAPQGAVDLIGYLGALWLLGGCDTPQSATTHSCTTLYYSNPINAGGGSSAGDWEDVNPNPITGIHDTNKITIDQDSSDPGIGLAVSKTGLIVFRRNSVWVMRGTTPSNFSMVQISDEVGCLDARSIVQTDNGIYFISQKGLMLTDGSKITNVSGTVMYTLQQALALQQWNVIAGNGGYITCGLTSQGQILLSIGQRTVTGSLSTIWSAMYDQTLAAWVRITSLLWSSDNGTAQVGNEYPALIISDRVSPLRSVHVLGSTFLTMLEDQTLQYSFLNQSGLYDLDTTGSTHTIPINWTTRFVPIIGTASYQRKWGQVKRYMLDHQFATAAPAPLAYGWTVTPLNALGQQYSPSDSNIMTSSLVATSNNSSITGVPASAAQIQRDNLNFVSEVDDLSFQITYADANASNNHNATNVIANIFGVATEYAANGRDRR